MWARLISLGSTAASWAGGLFGSGVVKLVLAGLLAGLLTLLWFDYQDAKDAASRRAEQVKTLNETVRTMARASGEEARKSAEREAALRADLELSARVSQARRTALLELQEQLASIHCIERPDHEKNCPLHPAVVAAFDILRGEAGTIRSGHDPDRNADLDPAAGAFDVQPGPGGAPQGHDRE